MAFVMEGLVCGQIKKKHFFSVTNFGYNKKKTQKSITSINHACIQPTGTKFFHEVTVKIHVALHSYSSRSWVGDAALVFYPAIIRAFFVGKRSIESSTDGSHGVDTHS